MMKWPWSRNPPKNGPFLACPKCRKWASKRTFDIALTMTQGSELTCDYCEKSNPKYAWKTAGLTESGLGKKGIKRGIG